MTGITKSKQTDIKEDFAKLLEENLTQEKQLVGNVLKGKIIFLDKETALVDVGLKSEGRIPLQEFTIEGQAPELKIGDMVDVFLERMEGPDGEIGLSHEKARREASWIELEKSYEKNERVQGVIFGRVKGGFTVDLSGAVAFLPGSQVDIRPIRDIGPLMGIKQPLQILKMDRGRGNIVVSRRAVLEESRAEARAELIKNIKEGQVLEGIVKNITDYGAFVDLGGVDGLLHVTDISWRRVNHPSESFQVGDTIKVQVIRFNEETQRISFGMKQLESDPWLEADKKFKISSKHMGQVTNITDYGAFVELEPGIEGLIHSSEMSWTKKNIHPGKLISTSQEVEVKVMDIDPQKRRIGLSLRQCIKNPWAKLGDQFPVGTEIEGEIKNVTEFGLFVGLTEDVDGMVHMSDLSWDKNGEEAISKYNKGDIIKVKVLDVDPAKERVVLGVKQLAQDPFEKSLSSMKKGQVVTCEVIALQDDGIAVSFGECLTGFIRRAELSRQKGERRPDRFAVGEKIDAKISSIDKPNHKVNLSIKAREIEEEKHAMAKYGSADSGASLGDILGAAMDKAKKQA